MWKDKRMELLIDEDGTGTMIDILIYRFGSAAATVLFVELGELRSASLPSYERSA